MVFLVIVTPAQPEQAEYRRDPADPLVRRATQVRELLWRGFVAQRLGGRHEIRARRRYGARGTGRRCRRQGGRRRRSARRGDQGHRAVAGDGRDDEPVPPASRRAVRPPLVRLPASAGQVDRQRLRRLDSQAFQSGNLAGGLDRRVVPALRAWAVEVKGGVRGRAVPVGELGGIDRDPLGRVGDGQGISAIVSICRTLCSTADTISGLRKREWDESGTCGLPRGGGGLPVGASWRLGPRGGRGTMRRDS